MLDLDTLDAAARHYAGEWLRPNRKSPSGKVFVGGPEYVLQDFYNFTFKDEFAYLLENIKDWLGAAALEDFENKALDVFTPRSDKDFAKLLKERLAVDPDGNHIEGIVGSTNLGSRVVGYRTKIVDTYGGPIQLIKNVYWPIYAGEREERLEGRIRKELGKGHGADPLPEGTQGLQGNSVST